MQWHATIDRSANPVQPSLHVVGRRHVRCIVNAVLTLSVVALNSHFVTLVVSQESGVHAESEHLLAVSTEMLSEDANDAPEQTEPEQATVVHRPWNDQFELEVRFELNRPKTSAYRRPYVAVWIESKQHTPMRTLALYMMTKPPGPRWHRELHRWYRQDEKRLEKEGDQLSLIETVSSATRPAGSYKLVWDGKDDRQRVLPQGSYTVLIEAAREHGTYQLIRKRLHFGEEPWRVELPANEEVKSATLEYRKKSVPQETRIPPSLKVEFDHPVDN